MFELTDEQIQSLSTDEGVPPRVVNPRTHETFVLLRVEEYERLRVDDDYDASPWMREEIEAAAAEIAEATGWAVIEEDEAGTPRSEMP